MARGSPPVAALAPFRASRLPLEALGRVFAFAWPLADAVASRQSHAVAALLASREAACGPELMDAVARSGDLEMLAVLHHLSPAGCTPAAMDGAAAAGQLNAVRFLHHNRSEGCTAEAVDGALRMGHAEVARFLLRNVSARWSRRAAKWAVESEDDELLEQLMARSPDALLADAKLLACRLKRVDTLRLLYETGKDTSPAETLIIAAAAGDVEMLTYLCKRETGFGKRAMSIAISNGNLEVVKILNENVDMHHTRASRSVFVREASLCGQLEILKYLHQHAPDLVTTTEAMDFAAKRGHLDIVRYLHENRKEGCTTEAMDLAALNGHLDVIEFLDQNRAEGCTENAVDYASMGNHVEIVRYLLEHRREGFTNRALDVAVLRGYAEVVKLLLAHLPADFKLQHAVSLAKQRNHKDVLDVLETAIGAS